MIDKLLLFAYHEAGHIVMACEYGIPVKEAYISQNGGRTELVESEGPKPVHFLADLYCGGMAGVSIFLREIHPIKLNSLSSFTLHDLLSRPVAKDGAEEDIASLRRLFELAGCREEYSDEKIEARVKQITQSIVRYNFDKHRSLAKALYKYGHLHNDDIQHIWSHKSLADSMTEGVEKFISSIGKRWKVCVIISVLSTIGFLFYYRYFFAESSVRISDILLRILMFFAGLFFVAMGALSFACTWQTRNSKKAEQYESLFQQDSKQGIGFWFNSFYSFFLGLFLITMSFFLNRVSSFELRLQTKLIEIAKWFLH